MFSAFICLLSVFKVEVKSDNAVAREEERLSKREREIKSERERKKE